MKIYCNVCNKYRKFKKLEISCILKKAFKSFLFFTVSVVMNMKKIFKEESMEILKILGLITNIEEYQKIYNHVWRKHKLRI